MFSHNFIQRHLPIFAIAITTLCIHTLHAQNAMTVKFDENGIGTVAFPGALPVPLLSLGNIVDPFDPSSGIKPLAYNFVGTTGIAPLDGDVILTEINTAGAQELSDILRFEHGLLLVYSDKPTPGEVAAAADVGFPQLFQQNKLGLPETGPEVGPNGLFGYAPGAGQPGSFSAPVVYNFESDPAPTPEPGTLMALLPAGALMLIRRRRPIV